MRRGRRSPMRRRRPKGPPPQHDRAHRALQRAHRLMENGDYVNAADIFERLARGAHDRGMLRQAPRLYLQAGRAHMLAGDSDRGADLLRQGLNIFAEAQRWPQLHQAGQRVMDELEQWGHTDLAAEFDGWLKGILPEKPEAYQHAGTPARRPQLPVHCSSCGGPIRADDVEWLDATTAECPYCGSGVR
ncbi:MAG: hypothetical protein ISS57_16410 [Anaerolineales bacterium]|nr:hypothetical protein [Anaerolineales bacterium]